MSSYYYHLDKIDSTSIQLDKAYFFYEYLKDEAELGIIAIRKARIEYVLGNYENALKYSFKAIEYHRSSGNEAKMAISYLQLGNTYLFLSNYRDSKKYFELAALLFKESEDEYGYAQKISNIGLVEIKTKQYRKGIKKQFEALAYLEQENYAIDVGLTYSFLVEAFIGLEHYDSSRYYNDLSRENFKTSNYQKGIGRHT